MSYCRWSSMNWMCDVYTYQSISGVYVTHVAGRRRVIPPIPAFPLARLPKFGGVYTPSTMSVNYPTRWHRLAARVCARLWHLWEQYVHMGSMSLIPLRSIGLPYAGRTLCDDTARDCADRLEMLRGEGYKVPQYAIDRLREETKEA